MTKKTKYPGNLTEADQELVKAEAARLWKIKVDEHNEQQCRKIADLTYDGLLKLGQRVDYNVILDKIRRDHAAREN